MAISPLLFAGCGSDIKVKSSEKEWQISEVYAQAFADFLNHAIPEYELSKGEKFFFDKENCLVSRTRIYDLTDGSTSNTNSNRWDFKLEKNHVYYFYALDFNYAFSHIAYIAENGTLTFFESINCMDRGDNLQDVLEFLNEVLENNLNRDEIIKRVKNYWDYYSLTSDDGILIPMKCDCSPCISSIE